MKMELSAWMKTKSVIDGRIILKNPLNRNITDQDENRAEVMIEEEIQGEDEDLITGA